MATAVELRELERGDGAWENIQEVLRFGFRSLWGAFAAVDGRIVELEKTAEAQRVNTQRQQQHLEAIAQTLNAMSEQLRVEKEEATNQQLEARVQHLEDQHDQLSTNDSAVNTDNIDKMARHLALLEEEMGHVVAAVDRKADMELVLTQEKKLQDEIHLRCKKSAFDQEFRALQQQFQIQRQELQQRLKTSLSDLKTAQETLMHSTLDEWNNEAKESTCLRDKKQTERLSSIDDQIKSCCERIHIQQSRLDTLQQEIEERVCKIVATDREEISRQCSDAHGRIDYQFRTQEESFEQFRKQSEVLNAKFEKVSVEIRSAVEELDHRILERGRQGIEELHRQIAEEMHNALNALAPAKDKEQRKLKQHQHVVGRKMAELDQMLQLVGRQLIQNTSQLQVLRNEQLAHDFHLDLQNEDDNLFGDDLLVRYGDATRDLWPEVAPNYELGVPEVDRSIASISNEDAAELQARRSKHQVLQEQLDKKLHDYSQILNVNQRDEKTTQTA